MTDFEDFSALLDEYEGKNPIQRRKEPQPGDRVSGRIVSIGPEQALVDVGTKAEAVIAVAELTDAEGNLPQVGDLVESYVLTRDDRTGTLVLGKDAGRHIHDTAGLELAFADQLPVEGTVSGVTKGGLEVQVAGVRAFCPASQVDTRFVDDLEGYVGKKLSFRITKFEGGRKPNLVLSRRALLEEEARQKAAELRAKLEVGLVLKGTITSVKDYGAFVDLGGLEGMIHVSELSYSRGIKPQDMVSPGDEVEVSVLRIEQTEKGERIGLSIRALGADPWKGADERLPLGSKVQGTVTSLQPFGAFVELEPGLEGLVPIGELGSGKRLNHASEVLASGQKIEVAVLAVDTARRRLTLSLDTSAHEEAANVQAYRQSAARSEGSVGTFGELLRESLGNSPSKK